MEAARSPSSSPWAVPSEWQPPPHKWTSLARGRAGLRLGKGPGACSPQASTAHCVRLVLSIREGGTASAWKTLERALCWSRRGLQSIPSSSQRKSGLLAMVARQCAALGPKAEEASIIQPRHSGVPFPVKQQEVLPAQPSWNSSRLEGMQAGELDQHVRRCRKLQGSLKSTLRRAPARGAAEKDAWRRRGLAPVLYVQSHCDVPSDRDRYVRELMRHIQVDSYGKCLNNREFPSTRLSDTSTATTEDYEFMALISKYKFHLAMENAICPDYMTEKLWRPMHLGAVPIYRGSPSVRDWMPNNHSIILIDDFGSPRELADYIDFLDRHSDEYLKYLEYKRPGGITNQFLLDSIERREWGVNDMTLPNYLNGFECYVCDRENERAKEEAAHKRTRGERPAPEPRIAPFTHMGCPPPAPGYGNIEDIPAGDSWKEMWLQDYWQSLDQAEALTAMIHHNESDQERFWDYMHKIFLRRTQQR